MFFFKSFPGCKIVETQLVLFQNKNQSKQDTYNSKAMVVLLCFGESLNMFFKVRAKLAKMVKTGFFLKQHMKVAFSVPKFGFK